MRPPASLAAAAAALLAAAAVPLLVDDQYVLFMLSLSLIGAITALGLNVTNGYLGILNLSVGGQVALGAYVCAIAALRGVPVPAALLLGTLVGAFFAWLIFLLFARLTGFFFGLATIAAAEVVRLLVRNLDEWTNGVRGLRGYPKLTESPDTTYWVLLALLVLVIAGIARLVRSPLGVRWRAIRENAGKALSIGLPVRRLQAIGFVLSGAIMALGGGLLALLLQYIEPGIAGLNTLVQTVLMVALGGAGTIFGPVVGALAITVIPEFLRVANELRLVLYGATLIVVVLMIPGGIVGALERRARIRRRLAAGRALYEQEKAKT
ncbi:MAG TPA: branched-chain amino acid ABC transporter permease [Burkholderiales bacterium]